VSQSISTNFRLKAFLDLKDHEVFAALTVFLVLMASLADQVSTVLQVNPAFKVKKVRKVKELTVHLVSLVIQVNP